MICKKKEKKGSDQVIFLYSREFLLGSNYLLSQCIILMKEKFILETKDLIRTKVEDRLRSLYVDNLFFYFFSIKVLIVNQGSLEELFFFKYL